MGSLAGHGGELVAAFRLAEMVDPPRLVDRGEHGRIWRLDTIDGPVAVKELVKRQVEEDAALDVGLQEAMVGTSGLTLPTPLRTVTGAVLAEIGGIQVRAYGWVDLREPDDELDPVAVGHALAAMHRVDHRPAPPIHPWYFEPVGADRWHELRDRLDTTAAPFRDAFAAEVPILVELEQHLVVPTVVQHCHRDLWADNLRSTLDGRVCVIDWENCGLEDPSHELAMVVYEFASGRPGRAAALVGAYRDAGGPGRLAARDSFTMVIAQFGHFHEAIVETWTDPTSSDEARAHMVDRFDELMDRRLTIAAIDELIDATRRW